VTSVSWGIHRCLTNTKIFEKKYLVPCSSISETYIRTNVKLQYVPYIFNLVTISFRWVQNMFI